MAEHIRRGLPVVRRFRRAVVGLVIVGIAALAAGVVAASAGLGEVALPYHDDFSHGCPPWPVGTDDQASFGCAGGAYHVHILRNPSKDEYFRMATARGLTKMVVAADLSTKSVGRNDASGVGCWTTKRTGYTFLISPGQNVFVIQRAVLGPPGRDRYTGLKIKFSGSPMPENRNRIYAVCTLEKNGAATFDLWINRVHAERATDPHAFGRFHIFGFQLTANRRGADFLFSSLLVDGR